MSKPNCNNSIKPEFQEQVFSEENSRKECACLDYMEYHKSSWLYYVQLYSVMYWTREPILVKFGLTRIIMSMYTTIQKFGVYKSKSLFLAKAIYIWSKTQQNSNIVNY